ncbi:MAG: response regulator transcription factor [Candidatus Sulfotelmatobacter sp.]
MSPHARTQTENADSGEKIRCVLAHSYGLLREGVRRLLQDEPDLEVVGEAGNAAEMLRLVCERQPDVVIADAHALGFSGPEAERLIRKVSAQSRVVFLNQAEEDPASHVSVSAETQQTLPRQTTAEQLVRMVRSAAAGGTPALYEMPRLGRRSTQTLRPRKQVLTAREREVLKLLVEGRTVRSAASALGVSAKTVDAHKFNLMRKLGVHNKVDLVMSAIQMGVVKVPVNF